MEIDFLLKTLSLSLAFLPDCVQCQSTKILTRTNKPNVLFIISDDLNCRIGCYGDNIAKTPNIDRLAKRGIRFDKAYCQFPVCGPSRSSVLSGRYPTASGVLDNNTWLILEKGYETLPDYFSKRGYDVKMFGKIFHPPNIGFEPGANPKNKGWFTPLERYFQQSEYPDYWDKNHSPYRNLITKDPLSYSWANEFGPISDKEFDQSQVRNTSTPAAKADVLSADSALYIIQNFSKSKKPFFLAVGFHKPHVPLKVPKEFFDLYNAEEMQLPSDFNIEPVHLPGYPIDEFRENIDLFASRSFTVYEAREAMKAYYACVSFLDAQLGRILDEMDRLNLSDNTIIVFWGDHGWHLSEKGMWAKGTLFEVSSRGPLIIVDPRINSNVHVSPGVVQYLDIFPTLIDLCNLPVTKQTQGRSLRPLLENPDEEWNYPAFTVQTRGWFIGRSVRTERYRYTEWDEGRRGAALFDHYEDPNEMVNLVLKPKFISVVDQMKKLLMQADLNVTTTLK